MGSVFKNKHLIEINLIVSFEEIHRFNHEFETIFSSNLCYCLTAGQTLSLHFLVECGPVSVDYFYDISKSKVKPSLFLFCHKQSLPV
jgi:hypothetical protein